MREGILLMDHDTAVRQRITERYLLNELDPQARDEFEEHYFDCPDCAADVHAGALFVEQSKVVLASEESKLVLSEGPVAPPAGPPISVPASSGWFAWLRPRFAVPVFALLLIVIGVQVRANHFLRQEVSSPQVLASAVVNVNIRGMESITVPVHVGQAYGLILNVPPGSHFSSYKLDLFSPQTELEWSRTIPAAGNDTLSLYVPRSDHEPGTLAVHGIAAGGESVDLGRYPIELQDQK
jgi:anti-sigma factor RsiW